ncbi:MAG TPA: hypothetical protein VE397_18315 [Stellaceae bacterium]|jgi:hypothetical protein|nr:hypothetical protein [Stellaceae bacterium]
MYRFDTIGCARRVLVAIAGTLALGALSASLALADPDVGGRPTEPPSLVAVETTGSVPGIGEGELERYVADQMNAAHAGVWKFVPVEAASPENRIEWSFTTAPSASGAVRTYGFSRAMMERLIDAHHYLTIEAKLYWHGQYQTVMLGHATIGAGLPDPALTELIARMTRLVMSYPMSDMGQPRTAGGGQLLASRAPLRLP